MRLKVINSNSQGNAYILHNDQEALLLECGVRFDRIKQALGFNVSRVVGCLVTHEHKDHSAAVYSVIAAGIDVYASGGTHSAMKTLLSHRAKILSINQRKGIGGFEVLPFDVNHDAAEPMGFLIRHAECGTVLFLTDAYYCEYNFKGLNHVIIEANYCEEIIDRRLEEGHGKKFLRDRVIESHMSLNTCKQTLSTYDLSRVRNIILIHLSDNNSDAERFKREVQEVTGKTVHVADAGMEIDLNLNVF